MLDKYKKIAIVGLVLSSALLLSACKKYSSTSSISTNDGTGQSQKSADAEPNAEKLVGVVTVTATDSGFEPKSVTVKAGEAITWVNESTKTVQVGSADHPTHTKNPELTGGEFAIELALGEAKTVSAGTGVGTWGYHDHLNPLKGGSVTVK